MHNSDRKWISKLGKFLYSLNFVHEYYTNYRQVYYACVAVIISIDERNSVESTISKKIRKLSFEPGVENGGFFHVVFISRSTGCRGALYHPPAPSIYIEPNRWSIRWLGKIVHTTHPWRNISRRRDGSRSARLEYKMDYPSPLSREEKRNICSGVDDLKRNLKFRNLFGNYYHYQLLYYFVFLCYLYTNYFYSKKIIGLFYQSLLSKNINPNLTLLLIFFHANEMKFIYLWLLPPKKNIQRNYFLEYFAYGDDDTNKWTSMTLIHRGMTNNARKAH